MEEAIKAARALLADQAVKSMRDAMSKVTDEELRESFAQYPLPEDEDGLREQLAEILDAIDWSEKLA